MLIIGLKKVKKKRAANTKTKSAKQSEPSYYQKKVRIDAL